MSRYVDGFVLGVPKKKVKEYTRVARAACKIWMELGALQYVECAGDDLKCKWGVPFPKLAKAKKTDTVFFSYVVYASRAHRDKVNAAVMRDPRLSAGFDPKKMPFDMTKMAMGGFKVLVGGRAKARR